MKGQNVTNDASKSKVGATVKLQTNVPPATLPKTEAADVAPMVVSGAKLVSTKKLIKKPEFLEKAIARTAVKKRDAKPAIEAALAELADLLSEGNELNLPPMGKLKLIKSKDLGDGAKVLTLKLRTMKDNAGQTELPGVDPAPKDE